MTTTATHTDITHDVAATRADTITTYIEMEAAQAETTLAEYLTHHAIEDLAKHYAAQHGWPYTPRLHGHTVAEVITVMNDGARNLTATPTEGVTVTANQDGVFVFRDDETRAVLAVCVDVDSAIDTLRQLTPAEESYEAVQRMLAAYTHLMA